MCYCERYNYYKWYDRGKILFVNLLQTKEFKNYYKYIDKIECTLIENGDQNNHQYLFRNIVPH